MYTYILQKSHILLQALFPTLITFPWANKVHICIVWKQNLSTYKFKKNGRFDDLRICFHIGFQLYQRVVNIFDHVKVVEIHLFYLAIIIQVQIIKYFSIILLGGMWYICHQLIIDSLDLAFRGGYIYIYYIPYMHVLPHPSCRLSSCSLVINIIEKVKLL